MSKNFLRFKKRLNSIGIFRSVMVGAAVGLAVFGVLLILWKLAVIEYSAIHRLLIGIGAAFAGAGLTLLLSRKKDKAFAEELDRRFDLKARVQTMIEYKDEDGDLVNIQREDADRVLSEIPIRKYKFKGIWIYITAVVLSAAVLAVGVVVKDVRSYTPPEQVIPFELSPLQESGMNNLIKYVEGSEMEEEFRTPIVEELNELLGLLRVTDTQKEMLRIVNESMSVICDITYESSTATEILNALWDSDDLYFKHLAKVLDSSEWNEPDWGDFAEKLTAYEGVLMGDSKKDGEEATVGVATLKYALDTMSRKLKNTLDSSGIGEGDEIYSAINDLFNKNPGGFAYILSRIEGVSDEEARELLNSCITINSNALYNAVAMNKINAGVGEYAMIRLTSLFIVPLPEFERPEFFKNGETIGEENKPEGDNSSGGDGGIGGGATYGSNDMVLDPLTGEYVRYGDLLAKYNAIMYERLEGDSYTEEQKEAIKKYFDLLYSGIEEKEGK